MLSITAYRIEGGSRLVVGGDHPAVVGEAANWARRLSRIARNLRRRYPHPKRVSRPLDASLAAQLRQLAYLRDEGLITREEFEEKRR